MKGRVVHSQIGDVDQDVVVYWTGIEFVEPSEHVASAIAEFMESLRTHIAAERCIGLEARVGP